MFRVVGFAQLKADFTSSVSAGCYPLFVQFKDASTGAPSQWNWDFGNGNISAQQSPGTIYTNPGSYTVKLVVTNAGGQDSIIKVNYITVYAKPVINFSASPTAGCSPLPVQFTDNSNPGSGTESKWTWDFGDGQISNTQNPLHSYTTVGTFGVSLTVTNSFGCSDILQRPSLINVDGVINADFNYTYTNACSPPTKVTFNNTTNSGSAQNYQWFFGDGGSSTATNPVYTYNSNGKFNVQLIASTGRGCSDTVTKSISIGVVFSNFISPPGGCANQPISFTDSSSPTPIFVKWYFGDGGTAVGTVGWHKYASPGTYNVKVVDNFGSCADSLTKVFVVTDKPTPGFTSTGNRATCAVPTSIQFTNTSVNAVNYIWNFGDGVTSNNPNPLHSYTTAGFYTVTLIAINSNGCSDTLVVPKYVQIGPPRIDSLLNSPFAGCVPKNINFQAAISSGDPVTAYKWNFGDGGTSTSATPSYKYLNAGTYNVTLIVTTNSGCTDSVTFARAVIIGNLPTAKFTASPTNACSSVPIQFTNQSSANVTNWQWSFGDGTGATGPNQTHIYSDTGYFTITLTVESNGCPDSMQLTNYIYINPPVANFGYTYLCGHQFTKNFKDSSIGAKTWLWNFGDGTQSNIQNPSHTYSSGGTYIVKLTVINQSCSNTKADTLFILDSTVSFTYSPAKTTLCKYDTVRFTVTNYDPASVNSYSWNFGDSVVFYFNPIYSTITHGFRRTGRFSPYLIVQDNFGCVDTVRKPALVFNVFGPTANFTNTDGSCLNGAITFNDLSLPDTVGNHPINKWIWNYGDGKIDTLTGPPFKHIYNQTGVYSVELTVKDTYGCWDTLVRPNTDTITNPVAAFSLLDSVDCLKSTVSFLDSSQGVSLVYNWNFGDKTTSNQFAPQHQYAALGAYTVSLNVTDEFGCKDSITKVKYAKIFDARASFILNDTLGYCPPLLIQPKNSSNYYSFITWNFGDGNTSNQINPIHTYTTAGQYNLQLIVQGFGNCYDTASKVVTLLGPSGSFTYSPFTSCSPDLVKFAVKGRNVVAYQWDFGDGGVETVSAPNINYTYQTPGLYVPVLLIFDSSNCRVQLSNTADTIRVAGVIAKFGAITSPGCDSALASFTDSSQILFDSLVSRVWGFDDGTASSVTSPTHYYYFSGTDSVSLRLTTALGCVNEYRLPVNVVVNQSPVVNASIPSSICINSAANFSAGNTSVPPGTITWLWQFGNGDTSSAKDPAYTYTVANTYTVAVTATNEFGCADSIQGSITAQPLPPVDAGMDSVICLGQSVQFQATGANSYVWSADKSLSCNSCAGPLAVPDSTTRYYVTGTSVAGCIATDSVLIQVERPFKLSLSSIDTLCVGYSVILTASGAEEYNWQPSSGLNNPTIPNPVASPPATTIYTVVGTDIKQCFFDTASVVVNVFPNPTLNLTDSVVTIMAGSNYTPTSTASPDVIKWVWVPPFALSCSNCAQPTASPKQTTTYKETVYNMYGCSATDNVTVKVLCNQKSIYIPNTFSPNGDGMNDYFYPRGAGLYSIRSMRIFNRWGQIVFEKLNFAANDVSSAWDGKFNGQVQPADVYVYYMEIICDNGTVVSTKGNITLLR